MLDTGIKIEILQNILQIPFRREFPLISIFIIGDFYLINLIRDN